MSQNDPTTVENVEAELAETPDASEEKVINIVKENIEQLEAEIVALREEIAKKDQDLKTEVDRSLRALAEMENFKRRKEQEKEEFQKYATTKLIGELLNIMDSFDRATQHAAQPDAASNNKELAEGFDLIKKQLAQLLQKQGVQPIEALNQPFDPNFHQAVSQLENKEVPPQTVVQEFQKGYKLHDRVIRPTMVVVSI